MGIAVLVGLALTQSTPAYADKAAPAVSHIDESTGTSSWYGWQTMVADAASVSLVALGGVMEDAGYQHRSYRASGAAILWTGVGGLFIAAPVVHGFVHHRWGAAAVSAGLRLGGSLLGGLAGLGVGIGTCGSGPDAPDACPAAGLLIGAAAGLLAASIVDAAVVAREPDTTHTNDWTPTVAYFGGQIQLGVVHRF